MVSYSDAYHEAFQCREDMHPIELMDTIINECIILPNKSVQLPIMIALAIMPSKYCSVLPLVINYGASGTGKSTFGKAVHGIWNLDSRFLLAGKTTPTAIRNLIMAMKYGDDWYEDELGDEDNAVLVWDDVDTSIISDTLVMSILKSGYSRKTANIGIASSGGVNQYFNFFSSKFTSTIHPLWSIDELKELKRRSVIIQYQKYSELSPEDKEENKSPDDLTDIDYVDFEGYKGSSTLYLDNAEAIECKRSMVPKLKNALKVANFPSDFGKLMFDVILIGTKLGAFSGINDAIFKLEKFYSFMIEVYNEQSEFDMWLKSWVNKVEEQQRELIQVKKGLEPITIARSALYKALKKATDKGVIPCERRDLLSAMKGLGYKIKTEGDSNEILFIKDAK